MNEASRRSYEETEALAAELNLPMVSHEGSLWNYAKKCWRARHFAYQFAVSKIIASSSVNRLGLLWEFLTPLMTAAMYYLAFGVLLGTRKDSQNFVFFLIAGVFTYNLFLESFNESARALVRNRELANNIRFPAILIPASAAIQAMLRSLPTTILLIPVAIFTGEHFNWTWLLLPFQLITTVLFGAGLGILISRPMRAIPDIAEALPIVLRVVMFTSGIFFDINIRYGSAPEPLRSIVMNQPIALLLNTTRGLFINADLPNHVQLLSLAGGTVVLVFLGFFVYWRAERHG